MSNPNKRRGDQGERDALAMYRAAGFPGAERTRPGRKEDEGDIHLAPGAIAQVKNCKALQWREWLAQLAEQKKAARAALAWLVVRRPGRGPQKPVWLAVMTVEDHAELVRRAGWGNPIEEDET